MSSSDNTSFPTQDQWHHRLQLPQGVVVQIPTPELLRHEHHFDEADLNVLPNFETFVSVKKAEELRQARKGEQCLPRTVAVTYSNGRQEMIPGGWLSEFQSGLEESRQMLNTMFDQALPTADVSEWDDQAVQTH